MNELPELRTALLDLLVAPQSANLRLILGGGYGLVLKREYVRNLGVPTLLKVWPEARSTNDLDLFLRAELLIDSKRLKPLRESLTILGYQVIQGAEHYQFVRPGPLKIDLLTGPASQFANSKVKVDERRASPRPSEKIHAHITNEAIALEEGLSTISVQGTTSTGQTVSADISIPHPFTYLLMKLHAYRDQVNDPVKDYGAYHAMDLYGIIAMTTEQEWNEAKQFRLKYGNVPEVQEASRIVNGLFGSRTTKGVLAIRENPYFQQSFEIDDFIFNLNELFPV
jgi:hypothetical protein